MQARPEAATADLPAFDTREFRNALGSFATGVTVITTVGPDGEDVGVTASSFNSVSLDPPLILWSLDKRSMSMEAFEHCDYFVVNVLGAEQVDISNRFARAGEDKFAGLEFGRGLGNVAMLPGSSARFQCRPEFQYEGGDHVILVGRVVDFDVSGRPGLVFQQGRYAVGADHPMTARPADAEDSAGFVSNFLPYMTGRCHQGMLAKFQQTIASGPLTDHQYRLLFSLKDLGEASPDRLCELSLLSLETVEDALSDMVALGLAISSGGVYAATAQGLQELSAMEAAVLNSEKQMLSVFSPEEADTFKRQLARLMEWNCQ
jgi:flavin reductase (DIM6/NTAB) family NADH-FMN oxidoreductase RutF/DNA-binding MarR family transcriptional regulator